MNKYWIKGGLLFTIFGLVTLLLALVGFLIHSEPNYLSYFLVFHPIIVFLFMGIQMSGSSPMSLISVIASGSLLSFFSLSLYFIVGSVAGIFYGKVKQFIHIGFWQKMIIFSLPAILPALIIFSLFAFERPNHSKIAANEECDLPSMNFKFFFNEEYCYQINATIKKDVQICSRINKEMTLMGIDNNPVVSQNQCYTQVALEKENPEVCNLIVNSSEKRTSCLNKVNEKIELCNIDALNKYVEYRDGKKSGVWWGGYESCAWVKKHLNP